MGKNKKKPAYSRREEQQGKKVLIGIGIAAILLVILMFIGYSFMG